MSFDYFAYGSNLWPPQMRSRCPSAVVVGTGELRGWAAVYDKPSTDGSAKLNLRSSETGATPGVVYRIDDDEAPALARAEPGYVSTTLEVDGREVVSYIYPGPLVEAKNEDLITRENKSVVRVDCPFRLKYLPKYRVGGDSSSVPKELRLLRIGETSVSSDHSD